MNLGCSPAHTRIFMHIHALSSYHMGTHVQQSSYSCTNIVRTHTNRATPSSLKIFHKLSPTLRTGRPVTVLSVCLLIFALYTCTCTFPTLVHVLVYASRMYLCMYHEHTCACTFPFSMLFKHGTWVGASSLKSFRKPLVALLILSDLVS